ncbi:MAG TPA: tetratricopeptide repeat protein [Sphingomicrobium sp.]|nr:tetratricopeptide repeat protein [Sphingomicrobium sp.]
MPSTVSRFPRSPRNLLLLASLALLAALCIRSALVAAAGQGNISLASAVWPGHPDVLRSRIMLGIAEAASRRKTLSPAIDEDIRLLSRRAPLAPEPFAVEGAIALRAGKYEKAERLLVQARKRDPRDRGVRFLLADLYMRQQKVAPGLQELIALSTLSPGATPSIAAMLASYAHTPGAVPRLRGALRLSPAIEQALLSKLAEDGGNAGLVLSLAAPVRPTSELADWQKKLLGSLVRAGKFREASSLWQQFSGRGEAALGDFSGSTGSPFEWNLLTSADGAATATGEGVDLQYFGRRDVSLAGRVINLGPGHYELSYRLAGSAGDPASLHWTMTCLSGNSGQLLNLPFAKPAAPPASIEFDVPAGCEAQRIEIKGLAQVYPAEVAVSISGLEVRRRA